jgi:hypothetical protein
MKFSLPYHVSHHPFLLLPKNFPITVVRGDAADRTDLETLAIDSYGTKRPEQAYGIVNRSSSRWLHLYTCVPDIARLITMRANPGNDEDVRRKPYVFHLAESRRSCYLRDGQNTATVVHTIVDKESGKPSKAEVFRASVNVERRYLRPPHWLAEEIESQSIDNLLVSERFTTPSRVKLLSKGESNRYVRATGLDNIDDALYVINKLPHSVVGTYLANQSVPAIFTYRARDHVSFSDHRIGPVASAGITAGVRRFIHRVNTKQFGALLDNEDPIEHAEIKEVVRGMEYWRHSNERSWSRAA